VLYVWWQRWQGNLLGPILDTNSGCTSFIESSFNDLGPEFHSNDEERSESLIVWNLGQADKSKITMKKGEASFSRGIMPVETPLCEFMHLHTPGWKSREVLLSGLPSLLPPAMR